VKKEKVAERIFFLCVLVLAMLVLAVNTCVRGYKYIHTRGLLIKAEQSYHDRQEEWLRELVQNDKLRGDAATQRKELSKRQGLVRQGEETIYPQFDDAGGGSDKGETPTSN